MGTLIPKLLELIVGETAVLLVHLTGRAPLVLPSVPLPQERVDEDAHADHAERDAVTADVLGRIGDRVDEGRHDAGRVSDGELHARCGGAFAVSGGVCWELRVVSQCLYSSKVRKGGGGNLPKPEGGRRQRTDRPLRGSIRSNARHSTYRPATPRTR